MKIALSLGLTLCVLVLLMIKKLKPHRGKIILVYAVGVTLLFAVYNFRTASLILPLYYPKNQMFYQTEFLENGEYTDALLPYILDGKSVHVPEFFLIYREADLNNADAWEEGLMQINDTINILEEFGAKVVPNPEITDIEDYRAFDEITENAGYLNDTYRYSYFYNNLDSEYGNGFRYYWFYSEQKEPFSLKINTDGLEECDDLYMLCDYDCNIYLVSEKVYKEVTGSGCMDK